MDDLKPKPPMTGDIGARIFGTYTPPPDANETDGSAAIFGKAYAQANNAQHWLQVGRSPEFAMAVLADKTKK